MSVSGCEVLEKDHRYALKLMPEASLAATFNHHVKAVQRVIELLRWHIEKEETVLFPLVGERLSASDRRRLADRLEALQSD